jgi:UDP-glucuronate 4-epimerase
MANYLVTGAAGFIGSNVVQQLCDAGHTVTGIDNLNDAYDVRLKEWRLQRLRQIEGFTFERMDMCDRRAVEKLFDDADDLFDGVLNRPWRTPGSTSTPILRRR